MQTVGTGRISIHLWPLLLISKHEPACWEILLGSCSTDQFILSADPHWLDRWLIRVPSAYAEQTQPSVLYGRSNLNVLPVRLQPTAIRSNPPNGWGTDPPPICFWWIGSDQISAGVKGHAVLCLCGHVSVDTRHSFEGNGWSDVSFSG